MIKYGEPNPLAVFGLRQLEFRPPHFTVVHFDLKTNIKSINDWIWENLEGRFWVGDYYYVDNSPSAHVIMSKAAAFERAAEASYFALAIDQINVFNLS